MRNFFAQHAFASFFCTLAAAAAAVAAGRGAIKPLSVPGEYDTHMLVKQASKMLKDVMVS